jgi:MYXO-CTERM domain-containing protein
VTFGAPGLYVLEVSVHDGEHTTAAELTVDVWEPEPVAPPEAPAEPAVWSCAVSSAPRAPGVPFALLIAVLLGLGVARRRR